MLLIFVSEYLQAKSDNCDDYESMCVEYLICNHGITPSYEVVTNPPCGSSIVTVSLIIASVYTRLNVEIPLETGGFSTFSAVGVVWAAHTMPKKRLMLTMSINLFYCIAF